MTTATAAAINTADWTGTTMPGYMGATAWAGSKSGHYLTGAELNKVIRADLKAHGITGVSLKKGGYSSISVTIKASAEDLTADGLEECGPYGIQVNQYAINRYADYFTPEFLEKIKAVRACMDAYRRDDSNVMVDYFDSNFYYFMTVKRASR